MEKGKTGQQGSDRQRGPWSDKVDERLSLITAVSPVNK
jgi:hypothetical protein